MTTAVVIIGAIVLAAALFFFLRKKPEALPEPEEQKPARVEAAPRPKSGDAGTKKPDAQAEPEEINIPCRSSATIRSSARMPSIRILIVLGRRAAPE